MVFNNSTIFLIWCFSFLVSEKISISPLEALITCTCNCIIGNQRSNEGFDDDVFISEKKIHLWRVELNINNTYRTDVIWFSWVLYGFSVISGLLGMLVGSTFWDTTRQWIHCSRVWQNRLHALVVGEFFSDLKTYKCYVMLKYIVAVNQYLHFQLW